MEKICGIYKITSPSEKIYIGQSININKRFREYKKIQNCKHQTRLFNSFKKHGIGKHRFEIICQCAESELNDLEKYYIGLYQTFNSEYGLNLRDGGRKSKASDETRKKISESLLMRKEKLGYFHSPETIKKISISNTGFKHSEKSKKLMSETRRGVNNPNFGKPKTEEIKQKMRTSALLRLEKQGYINSHETRKKISETQKNNPRKWSDDEKEYRRFLMLKRKEELGYINSPQARKKLSEKAKERYSKIPLTETELKILEYKKNNQEQKRYCIISKAINIPSWKVEYTIKKLIKRNYLNN